MSSFVLLLEAYDRIRDYWRHCSKKHEESGLAIEAAISAVVRAANHTRAYIADVRSDSNSRNRETERELSDEWVGVGEAIRQINDENARSLYKRCFMKAEYWSDPQVWDDALIDENDIRLEKVLTDVMAAIDRPAKSST